MFFVRNKVCLLIQQLPWALVALSLCSGHYSLGLSPWVPPSSRDSVSVSNYYWVFFFLLVSTFLQHTPFYNPTETGQLAMLLLNLCEKQKLVKQDFYNDRIKLYTTSLLKLGLFQQGDKHTVYVFWTHRSRNVFVALSKSKSVCLSLLCTSFLFEYRIADIFLQGCNFHIFTVGWDPQQIRRVCVVLHYRQLCQ